nr:ribonuclease H-like domain-containing protein [Tanacetum cinerariifolium]
MAFISSSNTSSGKSEVPTIQGVSTASAQVSTNSIDVVAGSLSYDTVCAFIATQTSKKITIQGSDVAGFDKSKVEYFNCHKMGHFAREYRSPRSQDRGKRESYKKDPKVEEPAGKAMIAIDGIGWIGFIWLRKMKLQRIMLLWPMKKNKNTKNLNTKISKLNEELRDYKTDLYNYKRGLSQVEARLVEFKENEIKYYEKIKVFERDIELKENKIKYLRNELEEIKKEKESIDFKIENFENVSKDLNRILESQKLDKDKKGMGFNEYCGVSPPSIQVYSPAKKDLSWMGLPEFVDDTATDYIRHTPSIDVSKSVSNKQEKRWKSNNPSFFEQGGSSGNVVKKPMIKFVKESGCPNATKVNNTENTKKPTVKYAEMYTNTSQSPRVRINQRNWNNQKSQQLKKDFMMQNKACYNCGSFDHLEFNCKHDIWVDK